MWQTFWNSPWLREARPSWAWVRQANLRREVVAGVLGAILVIPQAVTFAHLAGLPPEFGIHTAIFVSLLTTLLGASLIVGGPNTAVAILIGQTALHFAGQGSPLYIDVVMMLSFTVGVIQLLFWVLRTGGYFQYFSPAAIAGITHGVGALLVLSSLEGALGMEPIETSMVHEKLYVLVMELADLANPYAAVIGLGAVSAGIWTRRRWPRYAILAVFVVGWLLGEMIHAVIPQGTSEVALLGVMPVSALPLSHPRLQWEFLSMAWEMLPSALLIALIGLAQTMVIAKGINLSGVGRVDLNRETYAQGLANLLAPFFSSFAGSGSFNRTAANLEMGGRSPLGGVIASVAVWGLLLAGGGLLARLPMPAMAAVLFVVGWGMFKPREIRVLCRQRQEGIIFALTTGVVVLLGLQSGIVVGLLLSLIPFLLGAARVELRRVGVSGGVMVEVYGNLFHATLDGMVDMLRDVADRPLILNLRHVSFFDAAAGELILREGRRRGGNGTRMVILATQRVHQALLEELDALDEVVVVGSLPEARVALLGGRSSS